MLTNQGLWKLLKGLWADKNTLGTYLYMLSGTNQSMMPRVLQIQLVYCSVNRAYLDHSSSNTWDVKPAACVCCWHSWVLCLWQLYSLFTFSAQVFKVLEAVRPFHFSPKRLPHWKFLPWEQQCISKLGCVFWKMICFGKLKRHLSPDRA